MVHESATAISTPLQKRRRPQTTGSRTPSGKKSIALPRALCWQNPCALEPVGIVAEEQVNEARSGWSSIPPVPAARRLALRFGVSVAAATPER